MNTSFLLTNTEGVLSLLPGLVLMVLMIASLYFFTIRPQQKEQKKQKNMQELLKVGDEVVTIGGVMGKIVNIKENEITIASSVVQNLITFKREAISEVLKKENKTDQGKK